MTPSLTRPHSLGRARGNSHTYMQMRERPDPGPRPLPPSYLNATNPDLHLRSTARRRDGTRHRAHTHMQMQNHITSDTQSMREREGMAPLTCAPAIGARFTASACSRRPTTVPRDTTLRSAHAKATPLPGTNQPKPTCASATEQAEITSRNIQTTWTLPKLGHATAERRSSLTPSVHPAAPHPANANPNLLPNPTSPALATNTATTTSLRQSNTRADTSNRKRDEATTQKSPQREIPAADHEATTRKPNCIRRAG